MKKKFESPRTRRLRADRKALETLAEASSIFTFDGSGDPPDFYVVTFRGPGTYLHLDEGCVKQSRVHLVEIRLGAEYPRLKPVLLWQTPIFHPNISSAGAVCLGGYTSNWVPSVGLADLCEMLWDMLRYANFDVLSPFNREAAAWAKTQTAFPFPLDDRPLRDLLARARPPGAGEGAEPERGRRGAGNGLEGGASEGIVFIGND